ncbi:uncharacterized protein [Ptychodera flava]|uniref:uncharacterized protein isoform X2 n=1 Tax=Ptychodera flava TaxID=63121 RepID=UPI00396A9DFF
MYFNRLLSYHRSTKLCVSFATFKLQQRSIVTSMSNTLKIKEFSSRVGGQNVPLIGGKWYIMQSLFSKSPRQSEVRNFCMSSNNKPSKYIRKLNHVEVMFDRFTELGYCNSMAGLPIKSTVEITEDMLREAMNRLRKEHVALRSQIDIAYDKDDKETGRYYVEMENGGFVDVKTSRATSDEIDVAMCEEGKFPLKSNKNSLWRCILLKGHWVRDVNNGLKVYKTGIIMMMNHAFVDGLGFIRYNQLLLEKLDEVVGNKPMPKTIAFESAPFPRPIQSLLSSEDAAFVFQDEGKVNDGVSNSLNIQNASVETKYLNIEIPRELMLGLKNTSHKHGGSLNSALIAVYCLAYIKVMNNAKVTDRQSLAIGLAASLKRYFTERDIPDLGMYVCSLWFNIDIATNQFEGKGVWKLANKIARDIRKQLYDKSQGLSNIKKSSVNVFLKTILDKIKDINNFKRNPLDLYISNMAYESWKFPEFRNFTLESFFCGNTGTVNNFGILTFMLSDKLIIIIQYDTEMISSDTAKLYKNEIETILKELSIVIERSEF